MLERKDKYLVLFESVEQLFYRNLLITQIILHELEHANQRKIVDNEQTLEAQILRLSLLDYEIKQILKNKYIDESIITYAKAKMQVYNDNYAIAPHERLAQIKSYQEILNLLTQIKKYVPNLLEFEQTNKLENLLRGFYQESEIYSPTAAYLIQNGKSQMLHEFNWYDEDYHKLLEKSKANYSFEDRLKYGLMIDEEEFDYCDQIIKTSRKYNC